MTPFIAKTVILKPPLKLLDWLSVCDIISPRDMKQSKKTLKGTSTVIKWMSTPKKWERCIRSIHQFNKRDTFRNFSSVCNSFLSLISMGKSAVKVARKNKYIALTTSQLSWLDVLGTITSFSNAIESCFAIQKAIQHLNKSKKFTSSLIKLIRKVGKLALSILAITCFFLPIKAELKLIFLTISTVNLSLSLFNYFFTPIPIQDLGVWQESSSNFLDARSSSVH